MQFSYRSLIPLLSLLCCISACYPHAGKPLHRADPDWAQLASDACRRGDERAFSTLLARPELQNSAMQCHPDSQLIDPRHAP